MESNQANIKQSIWSGGRWATLLTLLFVILSWKANSIGDLIMALPFFVLLYFVYFTLGRNDVAIWLRNRMDENFRKIVIFPAMLIALYYCYILINGGNPFQGTVFLLPYLIFFPALVFYANRRQSQQFTWVDFTTFFIFLLPTTLVDFKPTGNLPLHGGGFDSMYRIVVMLAAIYAFVVIRQLNDVGAYPIFKWKYLGTALWVWLAFYLFVLGVGNITKFLHIKGHDIIDLSLAEKIIREMTGTFLHTALFEELFFRGLLQNLLAKRIAQSNHWKTFWIWGLVVLLISSLLAGYALKGPLPWFPGLITVLAFLAAFGIERANLSPTGTYTALAMTSVFFGLVHFHAGSIIYMGLAAVAGWAYGYVYIKTKNIFYAALVHTLVNSSALIFGLELMK